MGTETYPATPLHFSLRNLLSHYFHTALYCSQTHLQSQLDIPKSLIKNPKSTYYMWTYGFPITHITCRNADTHITHNNTATWAHTTSTSDVDIQG